ncbi:hypothetical protein BDZ90DRAFT_230162 [Jaminaea rosea]|uniref:Uncharacterized protein n=1 Tax=Jaminaea rosea TaxID=1569628 RepID=A0A316UW85_9BASI|nr:hypothetical protein BDZ90DRAFT_230162 [Jaminaea rosea]PWN29264.1 hypothetical protein BDZ90DRAFT_230162 [Jaminaea rosea]
MPSSSSSSSSKRGPDDGDEGHSSQRRRFDWTDFLDRHLQAASSVTAYLPPPGSTDESVRITWCPGGASRSQEVATSKGRAASSDGQNRDDNQQDGSSGGSHERNATHGGEASRDGDDGNGQGSSGKGGNGQGNNGQGSSGQGGNGQGGNGDEHNERDNNDERDNVRTAKPGCIVNAVHEVDDAAVEAITGVIQQSQETSSSDQSRGFSTDDDDGEQGFSFDAGTDDDDGQQDYSFDVFHDDAPDVVHDDAPDLDDTDLNVSAPDDTAPDVAALDDTAPNELEATHIEATDNTAPLETPSTTHTQAIRTFAEQSVQTDPLEPLEPHERTAPPPPLSGPASRTQTYTKKRVVRIDDEEDKEAYLARHVKEGSIVETECGWTALGRLFGLDSFAFRVKTLRWVKQNEAVIAKKLPLLKRARLARIKDNILPGGNDLELDDDGDLSDVVASVNHLEKSCDGPEHRLTRDVIAIVAEMEERVLACLSRKGPKHSGTYLPRKITRNDANIQDAVVLVTDGEDNGFALAEHSKDVAFPPVITVYWQSTITSVIRSETHRRIHKEYWFETRAMAGKRGATKCLCHSVERQRKEAQPRSRSTTAVVEAGEGGGGGAGGDAGRGSDAGEGSDDGSSGSGESEEEEDE